MGCRIDYDVREGMLRAAVSGKSSLAEAAWVARDIAEQAGQRMVNRVLIDVRRLADRVGTLGMLSMAKGCAGEVSGYRVAVLDVKENDGFYALHEAAARARGYALRCFSNASDAVNWLLGARDRD